jgi:LacI family transcriptional regulator
MAPDPSDGSGEGKSVPDEGPRRRPSTIIDVATEAKVAIGTVSRYLNGLPVRASNRDQIETAIQRLGYRRNALAAAMKSDLTNTIGFMVPMLSEFHAAILQGLSQRMHVAGRAMITFCHGEDPSSVAEALDFFATHRVDCLVMDGHDNAVEGIGELIAGGTPVILYDNDIPRLPVDRVLVESRIASKNAVTHLLDIGHSRVAMLAGARDSHTGRERLQGYRDAMSAAGLDLRPEYIAGDGWSEGHGYAGMLRLLSLEERPTAVFASNYNLACGALLLLKERRMAIPEDISLISFDDIPLFRLYGTGITAVAQPNEMLAATIAGLIEARLSHESAYHAPQSIMLGCEIVLRGSARRPAARESSDG